ncbi:hypothetical protein EBF16_11575 [Sphingobium yanoikuyae]|uniref:DUF262 domain-containing protein n=2 Tax=Sphingobium yanoikuyae TaxID=13690 RepID=A0A3G2URG4_SPHYA|nr:hypothetical protein EBF16_11575 [Sphingobium yanoikuyae]
MPPITLAFISDNVNQLNTPALIEQFVIDNIGDGYILDGMQRLNTLRRAAEDDDFDQARPIYFSVVVAEKYDLILYRMITLNNGQKPMTVRHQIEMLTGNLMKRLISNHQLQNITVLSEKETENSSPRGSFRMVDVAGAYLAFLTNGPHNQNSRFIEEKLDEILVGKVMSSGILEEEVGFKEVIEQVDRLSSRQTPKDWLRNENNLIGFSLGYKDSFQHINALSPDQFSTQIEVFEASFQAINPSKVNVGKFRRELSRYFIESIAEDYKIEELTEKFFEMTVN